MKFKFTFFFSVVSATVTVTTTAYRDHGSKNRVGSVSQHSKEIGRFPPGFPLHSYMKQIYHTRARGNRNGSFTVSVRNQKILATSIRGFQPEKNGRFPLTHLVTTFIVPVSLRIIVIILSVVTFNWWLKVGNSLLKSFVSILKLDENALCVICVFSTKSIACKIKFAYSKIVIWIQLNQWS